MKKFFSTIGLVFALLLCLASCGKKKSTEPYTDSTSESSDIYNSWIKNVTYNTTAVNQASVDELKSASKSYYQVSLPQDVAASKKANVMPISAYDSKYDTAYANYASTNVWSQDAYAKIIDCVAEANIGAFDKFSTEIEASPEYIANTAADSRVLAVVYVPVKVVYANYKKKSLVSTTISYVLVPVYGSLTTKANDVIADAQVASMPTISFELTKKGAIK